MFGMSSIIWRIEPPHTTLSITTCSFYLWSKASPFPMRLLNEEKVYLLRIAVLCQFQLSANFNFILAIRTMLKKKTEAVIEKIKLTHFCSSWNSHYSIVQMKCRHIRTRQFLFFQTGNHLSDTYLRLSCELEDDLSDWGRDAILPEFFK